METINSRVFDFQNDVNFLDLWLNIRLSEVSLPT